MRKEHLELIKQGISKDLTEDEKLKDEKLKLLSDVCLAQKNQQNPTLHLLLKLDELHLY